MKIKLTYNFKDVLCDITHYEFTNHYSTGYRDFDDYEYEIDVSFDDFYEYMMPENYQTYTKDMQIGFEDACRRLFNLLENEGIDFDYFEDFKDYLTDKYEDDAREECEEHYAG